MNRAGTIITSSREFTAGKILTAKSTIIFLNGVKVTVESTAPYGEEPEVVLDHGKRYRVIIVEESE